MKLFTKVVLRTEQKEVIMNRLLDIFLAVILFSSLILAQNADQDSIKSTLNKLFDFSKVENFSSAAKFIAYDGNDQERYLISQMNINDSKEESKIKRIIKRIKAMLDISDSYSFGQFSTKQDAKFVINKIEVIFKSGTQELKTQFSFVKSKDIFLLTDLK